MDTLTMTGFLRARLAEDEWEAQRALSTLTNEINHARLLNLTSTREEILAAPHLGAPVRRMFAEVEAKRRIVGACAQVSEMGTDTLDGVMARDACRYSLRALAAVYADHPDFREAWKP